MHNMCRMLAVYLLHATKNQHVAISHRHDGGVPAPAIHLSNHRVVLCGGVEEPNDLIAICQEWGIQIEVVTCKGSTICLL